MRIRFLLLILLLPISIYGIGEIDSENIDGDAEKDCVTNTSPLTSDINICPLDSASYDEFDVIECACTLPPKTEAVIALNEVKNKKIGNVVKNIFNASKGKIADFVELAGQMGIRADLAQSNLCSIDAISEVIKQRMVAGSCSLEKINNNSMKYFDESLRDLYLSLGERPNTNRSSDHLFIIPVSKRNTLQCLTDNPGNSTLNNFLKGSAFEKGRQDLLDNLNNELSRGANTIDLDKNEIYRMISNDKKAEIQALFQQKRDKSNPNELAALIVDKIYSSETVSHAVNGLQNQCGFLMASIGDLLCSDGEVSTIGNQDFIEKQLDHDPFNIDLENDLYYATQSLYCSGKKNAPLVENGACLTDNSFTDAQSLLNPKPSFLKFDQFISCHENILGDNEFLNTNSQRMARATNNSEDETKRLCSFLGCSNILELASQSASSFTCDARGPNYSLNKVLLDLAKIDCSEGNNHFCVNGDMTEEFIALQKMIIIECRQTSCLSDTQISEALAKSIEQNSEIRNLVNLPKGKLLNASEQEDQFWNRFQGDTYELAKSPTFNSQNYTTVLNEGFVGRGYREAIETLESRQANSQNDSISPIPAAKIERANIVPGNSSMSERLNAEINIGERLEQSLANARRQMAVIENTPEYSPNREEAFRQLGYAQASVENIKREFENLKAQENTNGNDASFEQRYAEEFAAYPFTGGITVGGETGGGQRPPTSYQQNFGPTNTGTNTIDVARNINSFTDNFRQLPAQSESYGEVTELPQRVDNDVDNSDSDVNLNQKADVVSGSASRSPAAQISGESLTTANTSLLGSRLNHAIGEGEFLINQKGREIVIDPRQEVINIDQELSTFMRTHSDFKIGESVVLTQLDSQTGAKQRARLIPLFNDTGAFREYGISSDVNLRERIRFAENSPIEMRFLTRNEAYQQDMRLFQDTEI